jgi:hypothetical protein
MKKELLTREELRKLIMTYASGITTSVGSSRKYINEKWQIHKEVHTKRKRTGDIYGGWKEAEVYLYVTWDKRVFRTVEEMYNALFLTPWFKLAEHKPVRKGYYQTDAGTTFWNGASFNTDDIVTIWRGLAKVPVLS